MARIIMMLNRLVIGGAPLDTVDLSAYLSRHHEVYLLVGDKNTDEMDASFLLASYPSLKVIHLPHLKRSINIIGDLKAFLKTRRIFSELKPDIVHTHGAKSGVIGRLAAATSGVKVIIHTYHGHVFHSYFNALMSGLIVFAERMLAAISTGIVAISDRQKEELTKKYRICKAEKVHVIRLGVDTPRFLVENDANRTLFRDKYLLQPSEVAIGIIGRMVPVKGHRFFAEVTEKVLRESKAAVRFFVIGDGELRKELQMVFSEKKIATVDYPRNPVVAPVTFTSWIFDIEKAMAGLDVVVLTSVNEGTPVTLLEAQAAGRPVVATDVGGVSEVVLNNVSGYVIPVGDLNKFATKVIELAADAGLRQQMGNEGRAFMLKRHTKEQQFESTEKLYRQLLEV